MKTSGRFFFLILLVLGHLTASPAHSSEITVRSLYSQMRQIRTRLIELGCTANISGSSALTIFTPLQCRGPNQPHNINALVLTLQTYSNLLEQSLEISSLSFTEFEQITIQLEMTKGLIAEWRQEKLKISDSKLSEYNRALTALKSEGCLFDGSGSLFCSAITNDSLQIETRIKKLEVFIEVAKNLMNEEDISAEQARSSNAALKSAMAVFHEVSQHKASRMNELRTRTLPLRREIAESLKLSRDSDLSIQISSGNGFSLQDSEKTLEILEIFAQALKKTDAKFILKNRKRYLAIYVYNKKIENFISHRDEVVQVGVNADISHDQVLELINKFADRI